MVNKFTTRAAITLREERKWIKNLNKHKKEARHFALDAISGIHIGSISLMDISSKDHRATYGILIGDKRFWGKGYGTEASCLVLDYGFKKLKLHRVTLYVYNYNQRALWLYRKLGFKSEGMLREAIYYGGRYHHDIVMGLLAGEWLKTKRRLV